MATTTVATPLQSTCAAYALAGARPPLGRAAGREAGKSDTQPESAPQAVRDLEAARRCLRGDAEAYRRLIERHRDRVSGMMWRFTRDPEAHADLVQDVFVEAYRALRSYRGRAPFEHWLSRVATRVGYRYWRREQRTAETVPLQEWHAVTDGEIDAMEPADAGERLHRLLAQLPPRDRLVLTLRYVEDKSVEETAGLTGWSRTMVKVQAWRARLKLKTLFEQATEGDEA